MNAESFAKWLLTALGIEVPEGADWNEVRDLVAAEIDGLRTKLAEEVVDDAIAAGMLFRRERGWALSQASDNIAIFRSFLKKRGKISPALLALDDRTSRGAGAAGGMNEVERDIARQMGVSEATFLKYNTPGAAPGMTPLEREIAAKVGVKTETFLKYNAPANP